MASSATLDAADLQFIFDVLTTLESIKPNWKTVAEKSGHTVSTSATRKFKTVLAKAGYDYDGKDGTLTKMDVSTALGETGKASGKKPGGRKKKAESVKSKPKKRKLDEDEEDADGDGGQETGGDELKGVSA